MSTEIQLIETYILYLDQCFISEVNIGVGWYRDLKRRDRVGNVATSQVVLTYSRASKSIPNAQDIFTSLFNNRLPDWSWSFISNIDNVGVVDSTAWVLQALLLKESPYRSIDDYLSGSFDWLVQAQNKDGGWGLVKGAESRIVSTSFVLRAMSATNDIRYAEYIKKAIGYILINQNNNYSWSTSSRDSCVAATSHAIIAITLASRSKATLPIQRAASWLLSECSLEENGFFESHPIVEEIEVNVNNRIIRMVYNFPVTPLAICALRYVYPSKAQVEKIFDQYISELEQHKSFSGIKTASGNDTSYGIHDIVMSIVKDKPINKYIEPCLSSLKKSIGQEDLPQLVKIGSSQESGCNNVNVIFIHGLGGDAIDTWLNESSDCFFPSIVASSFPSANVYTLGYENSSTSWAGTAMSLYDRSINIIKLLEVEDMPDGNIIFIGHSFGGLLIKSIVCGIDSYENDNSPAKKILERVKGVCFVATPHHGSKLANFAKNLSVVFKASASTKDLAWDNKDLVRLNNQYKVITEKFDIGHLSFSERKKTKGVTVVDGESADLGLTGARAVPIDENHTDIAKPVSEKSLVLKSMIGFIKEYLY